MNVSPIYEKAHKLLPKDAGRYAMQHAWLEPHITPTGDGRGGTLSFTDGRLLLMVPVEQTEKDAKGFVTAPAYAYAFKVAADKRKKDKDAIIDVEITATEGLQIVDGPLFPRPDDGEYPLVRGILKDCPAVGEDGSVSLTISADLLKKLADAMMADGGQCTVTFKTVKCKGGGLKNDTKPMRVTCATAPDAIAVLMPVSSEDPRLESES